MTLPKNVGYALVAVVVAVVGGVGLGRALAPAAPRSEAGQAPIAVAGSMHKICLAKLSDKGLPDNCAEVTFSKATALDLDHLKARGFKILSSTCKEAFPGAVPLASCTRSDAEDDAQPPTRGVAYYYDPTTLAGGDETYRGQCLGTGGSWELKVGDAQDAKLRARAGAAAPHHEIDSLLEIMH